MTPQEEYEEAEYRIEQCRKLSASILEISQSIRTLWQEGRVSMKVALRVNAITQGTSFPLSHGYRALKRRDYETVDWCLRVMLSRKANAEQIYDEIMSSK